MKQVTLTAPIHSPGGEATLVPSNSASEGEGLTRTGGGSCSELSSNITCIEIQSSRFISLSTSMHVLPNEICSALKIGNVFLKFFRKCRWAHAHVRCTHQDFVDFNEILNIFKDRNIRFSYNTLTL